MSATTSLKFSEADYLRFDPCDGDRDVKIECRTVRLVRARKSHQCFLGSHRYGDQHLIEAGDIYRNERALVDGDYWGTYRVCVPCMDAWLTDCGVHPVAARAPEFVASRETLHQDNDAGVK